MSTLQPDIGDKNDAANGDTTRGPGITALDREVRKARLAQAAHFDALVGIRDAQTLRLAALNDELQQRIVDERRLKGLLSLQMDTGFPPRLWLDDISYVEMEPDPRTFRLVRQEPKGHATIAETREMLEICGAVRRYAAHRLVEAERAGGMRSNGNSKSVSQLIMVWLAGFTFGVLALLAAGVLLGKISF